MKLKPVGQRIIVKRLSEKERSGIIVPELARRGSLIGQVVHKGPEAEWVNEGDIILFAKFSGFILPDAVGYEDCLIMNCEDILSKIDNYISEDAVVKVVPFKDKFWGSMSVVR